MTPAPRMIVRSPDPLNAETPADALAASFLTPPELFYIRSHGDVPRLDADHRVTLGGLVAAGRSYTIAELRSAFAERTVTATLQCAGNRRAHLQSVARTAGDPWDVGAIGNAEWTGIALADLLTGAGLAPEAGFVCATSADEVEVEGERAAFGISIPLAKALHPDTLVAWTMNGQPLRPEHGYPLRLIVPGYAGVRSAKWLSRLDVSAEPSPAPIQARDYKLFPASVAKDDVHWEAGLTIDAMPVQSAICVPADGATLPAGRHELRGYAMASGRGIARVDVSADGGAHWQQAALEPGAPWSWTPWTLALDLAPGEHCLVVRAVDEAGQMQPEQPENVWNFGGYLSTAWHRIALTVSV